MENKEILTTKPFVPPFEEYAEYLKIAFKNNAFTNNGKLLQTLEKQLDSYFDVEGIQCISSATIGLQMAIKALDIPTGSEILTTPFSYVATTTAILAEKCTPVFVDIETDNFTIDTNKIEQAITNKTKAIIPVHIFGFACNIDKINEIAKKYKLKVIYDAAHAFGVRYKGKSIIEYGDISVISMQESKLFHTVEGGIIFSKDKKIKERINLLKQCGHIGNYYISDGYNARLSELHAAMGLTNLKYINEIISKRKILSEVYDSYLKEHFQIPQKQELIAYQYPYYVVVFKSVSEKNDVLNVLYENKIYPWQCYYPTLNTLKYLKVHYSCPIAEDICSRILQMPLYYDLTENDITRICKIILKTTGK